MRVPGKKEYMEFCEEYINKMVPYYTNQGDQKSIIREMTWLNDFYQLIRNSFVIMDYPTILHAFHGRP